MSAIQWLGETLPNTQDCAQLEFALNAPDMGGPRQNWNFELGHHLPWPEGVPGKRKVWQALKVEIMELGIAVRDLREFSGLVIRSTPQWLARVQESGQYGKLVEPVVQVHHWKVSLQTQEMEVYENYFSLEWELRFGQLDEVSLPCELDVWAVIPEDEFFRTEPETAAELARFAEGEPVLWVMTRVDIIGGAVDMERCGDDPLPLARKRLHAALGEIDVAKETLCWDSNFIAMPEHKAVTEPGWRSKVRFDTWC